MIFLLIFVLLTMPSLIKSNDEKYKKRKEKEEFQRILREEIKHGKRWG